MRLGLIGTGAIAARHLNCIGEASDEIEVVAHLSRTFTRSELASQRFGGKPYGEIDKFISEGRPDAVIVTVPPSQHGMIEHTLIDAGIPFLVEKPIGLALDVPETIAHSIAAKGLVTAVGYNWRSIDCLNLVKQQLALTPPRMMIGHFHIGTPQAPWWRFEAESGGQMVEQACHLIDLARHLVGDGEFLAATGHKGPLPGFDDGDIASASAALFRFGDRPCVVTATCVLPHGSGAELHLICDGCEMKISLQGLSIIRNGVEERITCRTNSYAAQNKRFFDAVQSDSPADVFCTYADALVTHRLSIAAGTAIRDRKQQYENFE